jgi:hypothetical protein
VKRSAARSELEKEEDAVGERGVDKFEKEDGEDWVV